jgi:hypothetical protein
MTMGSLTVTEASEEHAASVFSVEIEGNIFIQNVCAHQTNQIS